VCTDDFTVSEDTGQLCINRSNLGLRQRLVFSTPGTFQFDPTDYPNLQRVNARMVGGGGGSSGASAPAGQAIARPGGSSGGYAETLVQRSQMAGIVNVTVGAGGTAGAANNGPGGDGGASSFGSFAIANGGFSGNALQAAGTVADVGSGPPGPAAGTGDIVSGGDPGEGGFRLSGTEASSGRGGSSLLGHGGRSVGFQATGQVGPGPGGGGGGPVSFNTAQAGAAGRAGIVILDLYF